MHYPCSRKYPCRSLRQRKSEQSWIWSYGSYRHYFRTVFQPHFWVGIEHGSIHKGVSLTLYLSIRGDSIPFKLFAFDTHSGSGAMISLLIIFLNASALGFLLVWSIVKTFNLSKSLSLPLIGFYISCIALTVSFGTTLSYFDSE